MNAMEIDWANRQFSLPAGMRLPPSALLRAALDRYRQAVQPADEREVISVIGALRAALPKERLEDEREQHLRWDVYRRTLGHLPADLLRAAADKCLRSCRFFPAPSEVLERAEPELARRRMVLCRLELLDSGEWCAEPNVPDAKARAEIVAASMPRLRGMGAGQSSGSQEDFLKKKGEVLRECAEAGLIPAGGNEACARRAQGTGRAAGPQRPAVRQSKGGRYAAR